jgi:hypothetical protein
MVRSEAIAWGSWSRRVYGATHALRLAFAAGVEFLLRLAFASVIYPKHSTQCHTRQTEMRLVFHGMPAGPSEASKGANSSIRPHPSSLTVQPCSDKGGYGNSNAFQGIETA